MEASARFTRMASELAELGAEAVVVQGARDAAADEARHRDLCALQAERFGEPNPKDYVVPQQRIGASRSDTRERLLWEVVAVCCLSETMNTSLLSRCQELVKDEELRSTIHELLQDEVQHARIGWAHLAAERAAGRGDFLAGALPLMLEASIEPGFLQQGESMPWIDELYDYGELPHAGLVRIYRETLDQVVFRGLEAMGVDTSKGRAWLAKQTAARG
jgi:hypothetical protein